MKALFVLLGVFLLALPVLKWQSGRYQAQRAGRIALAAMLLFTGISHFLFTDGIMAMVPDFLPAQKTLVYLTGVLELIFAGCLLLLGANTWVGWALILFFIAILPANVKAAMENINYETGDYDGPGFYYLWIRIPLQFFFITWVYYTTIKKNPFLDDTSPSYSGAA